MAADPPVGPRTDLHVPGSFDQVAKLARYQLREYLRSRRFLVLVVVVAVIAAILTAVVGYYRGGLIQSALVFYGNDWGGGADLMIILSAVIFGGDAIAGEFQNKTGYFLMGLPVRRSTVYAGKFVAAYLASVAILLLYLALLVLNGAYYFGTGLLPWQLGLSVLLALIYLAAVLGATFLFSSLFKTSAYGFVVTAILFVIGFSILQSVVEFLVKIEPWMVISYAESTIGAVFSSTANWGLTATTTTTPGPVHVTTYVAGIAEGVAIMIGYFLVTAIGGLLLFEREEFS